MTASSTNTKECAQRAIIRELALKQGGYISNPFLFARSLLEDRVMRCQLKTMIAVQSAVDDRVPTAHQKSRLPLNDR